jgi:tetratricopeptide (TPR) repeat protein
VSEENTPADPGEDSGDQRQELPTWNRGKSKRKSKAEVAEALEASDGDVFTRGVAGAGRAAASQSKLIVAAIVAGLAIIGAAVYWQQSTSAASAESTRELAELAAIPARGRQGGPEQQETKNPPPNPVFVDEDDRKKSFADALASAKGVNDEEVVALASLIEAADLVREGELDTALGLYDSFLAAHPSDHPMAFVAKEGRGLVLEAKGDLGGALAVFEAMTAQDHAERFYADMALWPQGRLLERMERGSDAVAVYKRYLELYPEATRPSLASDKVKARLRELDVPATAAAPETAKPETAKPEPAAAPAETGAP